MKTALLLGLCVVSTAFAKEIPKDEDYTRLLSRPALSTLADLERARVNAGETDLDLWSGSYWPMFQGSLGFRYRNSAVWALNGETIKYENYVLAHATPVGIDELSAAEKYDLLVGDGLKTFTATQWKNGTDNRGISGQVPTWRGICDGWAAAAQTWPRPRKAVTLTAANGTPVTFYPEDIKALGSQLHAKGVKTVTFLGRRCNGTTGHITGACDETNPGALHLALANRIGVEKKSFVVDASPGKEVWNYPVESYEFSYSNPLTGVSGDWRSARVNIAGNEERLVKGTRRAKTAVAVVGVTARVVIADMRDANTLAYDDESHDKTKELEWNYDLELDAQGKIVGGEWHEKNGPDFIWAPRETSRPVSVAEQRARLNYKGVITPGIQAAALAASAQAQPLAAIVDELFRLSAE